MGYLVFNMRDDDVMRFESALRKIEDGHHEIKELSHKMKEQFASRSGYPSPMPYGERGNYGERYDGRYSNGGGNYGERDFRPTPDWEMRAPGMYPPRW